MITPKSFRRVYKLTLLAVIVFGVTLTALLLQPNKASADICTANGRDCYFGYFTNVYDGGPPANGTRFNVMSAPALLNVNNAAQLVSTLSSAMGGCPGGALWNQNDQNAVGAAFIVVSMMYGAAGAGMPKNTACSVFAQWEATVYNLEASGHINFNLVHNFGGVNSRSTLVDAAFYPSTGSALSIVFYNPSTGAPAYAIKKDCANPLGQISAISLNYSLQPSIQVQRPDGSAVSGPVEPGEQIVLRYYINNTGTTSSVPVTCDGRANNVGGYAVTSPPTGGGAPSYTCRPPQPNQVFPAGSLTMVGGPENITPVANTTYCRTITVTPATTSGNTTSAEVCIPVVSKPYLKVYGGDISAGGGLETAPNTCTANNNAAVAAWNRGTTGTYSGAGAQYAVQAMSTITEFASAQGNAGGAPVPTGLAFANSSTNLASGRYGGSYGSTKCIPDYFSQKPTTGVQPLASLTPGEGTYQASGNTTLAGANINPGDKVTVYVDGNLFITANINFPGSWTPTTIPFLKVVVRGNIYISGAVTQLNGIFIAQNNAGAGGIIYTCASGFSAPTLANGAFYNSCTNKLTINGAFMAHSVEFTRTRGTLRAATTAEASSSANISETFNFGPAFWMMQPSSTEGRVDNYDAITSLAPVL